MPRGGSNNNHNMSRELTSRNLREFALYYVSAIFFRALAAFCYAEPVSTSAQNALGNLVNHHLVGDAAQCGVFLDRLDGALLQDFRNCWHIEHGSCDVDFLRCRKALDP